MARDGHKMDCQNGPYMRRQMSHEIRIIYDILKEGIQEDDQMGEQIGCASASAREAVRYLKDTYKL
jgi:hypothetical protein